MSEILKGLEFDPEALLRKYREERDKRLELRPQGNAQYKKMSGDLARFADDPYAKVEPRTPLHRDIEVAVLGGGFGALLTGTRLRQAGIDDAWLIEQGGDFGGTWYWNRYPGAACDTEAYVYFPLLEEVGAIPSHKYAKAPEILAHAQAIGRKFGLYEKALFHTQVEEIEWDEAAERWLVKTNRGDRIRARYFIMASGALQIPKLPGIPGIETFKGHSFHTSRWDYAYTGGTSLGDLTNLTDKRVGIIGTGATAVQAVPHLGAWAQHLYVFQRTPSGVDVRNDRPTDPDWVASLKPGWHKERVENFTALLEGRPVPVDLVDDGWTKTMFATMRQVGPGMTPSDMRDLMQLADFRMMNAVRARVDAIVQDKETAERLKPWYNRMCKRPCFHDAYLQTFNRPNVTLVDTEGYGVDEVTETAVVVRGKSYELDCLIFATGFELGALTRHQAFPIKGRGGHLLSEKWKDGATTLHGMQVSGFPNFFLQGTTQSAWGANFVHMLGIQAEHIAHILGEVRSRGRTVVEATPAAEAAWVGVHESYGERMKNTWSECTPGFFNNEGDYSQIVVRNGGFGGGVTMLSEMLKAWRDDGRLEGLTLS